MHMCKTFSHRNHGLLFGRIKQTTKQNKNEQKLNDEQMKTKQK